MNPRFLFQWGTVNEILQECVNALHKRKSDCVCHYYVNFYMIGSLTVRIKHVFAIKKECHMYKKMLDRKLLEFDRSSINYKRVTF